TASEAGANSGTFQFTRVGVTSAPLTVSYALSGSAANAADYALSNFALIPAGSLTANVTVLPSDDSTAEGEENVALSLFDTAGYGTGISSNAVVTIVDNDASVPPFALQLSLPSSNLFHLTLIGPATRVYGIDVASELNSWTPWTTQVNT